jgi:hypothetical protein
MEPSDEFDPDAIWPPQKGFRVLAAERSAVDGVPVVVTRWKLAADEVGALAQGGELVLSMVGFNMPPISLAIDTE